MHPILKDADREIQLAMAEVAQAIVQTLPAWTPETLRPTLRVAVETWIDGNAPDAFQPGARELVFQIILDAMVAMHGLDERLLTPWHAETEAKH